MPIFVFPVLFLLSSRRDNLGGVELYLNSEFEHSLWHQRHFNNRPILAQNELDRKASRPMYRWIPRAWSYRECVFKPARES